MVTNIAMRTDGHWILIAGYDNSGVDASGEYVQPIIKIIDPSQSLKGDNEFWISYDDIVNNGNRYCIPGKRIVPRYFESVSYMPK